MQLSEKSCIVAIEKSLENASDLFIDASILVEKKRNVRAYTLYHYSLEELSKSYSAIRIMLFERYYDEESIKSFRMLFKDHSSKIIESAQIDFWHVIALKDDQPEFAKDILEKLIKTDMQKQAKDFDNLKNKSLYTTYIDNTFKNPSEFITLEIMESIREKARVRLSWVTGLWSFVQKNHQELKNCGFSQLKVKREEKLF